MSDTLRLPTTGTGTADVDTGVVDRTTYKTPVVTIDINGGAGTEILARSGSGTQDEALRTVEAADSDLTGGVQNIAGGIGAINSRDTDTSRAPGTDAAAAWAVQGVTGMVPFAVAAASLPLPSGAATSAKQDTGNTSLGSIDTKLSSQATAANQATGNASLGTIDTSTAAAAAALGTTADADTTTTVIGRLKKLVALLAGGLPAALGSGGGLKVDGSGTALPVSGTVALGAGSAVVGHVIADSGSTTTVTGNVAGTNAASSQSDGHSANIGALADADTASTLTGLLKKVKALLSGGLPAALAAGGGLKIEGVAGGVTVPVTGTITAVTAITNVVHVDDNAGSLTVDGSITANAGTNLNTSALALESGGNLAGATTSLAVIDDWDESDRAKVNAIVGQAGVAGGAGATGATTQRAKLACDKIRVTATPTISTSIYASGDQFGTVMTFAGAALFNGGGGKVTGAVLTNRDTESPVLELWLFRVSPTMANSDNGVFDLTDANLEAGELIGVIEFASYNNTAAGQASVGSLRGQNLGGSPLHFVCASGATSIYGIFCVRSTPTQASTTDVIVALTIDPG